MAVSNLYPWFENVFRQISQQLSQDKLHHALLVTSPGGLGELALADHLAELLLCHHPVPESDSLSSCGQCKSCLLIAAGNHTDRYMLEPEEKGKPIKVDQIRAAIQFIQKTSQLRHNKVLIVRQADQMNRQAANALLKSLEEPPPGTYLLLISERPGALLPTLRSRCRHVPLQLATTEHTADWLAQHDIDAQRISLLIKLFPGAPVKAAEMAGNEEMELRERLLQDLKDLASASLGAIELAGKWNKLALLPLLNWLSLWFTDFCRYAGALDPAIVRDQETLDLAQYLTNETDTGSLFELTDDILAARAGVLKQANLNQQLVLERILIHWSQLTN